MYRFARGSIRVVVLRAILASVAALTMAFIIDMLSERRAACAFVQERRRERERARAMKVCVSDMRAV